jgi:hypothetical protein
MAFSQAIVEALGQAGARHQVGGRTRPMELGFEQSGKHGCPAASVTFQGSLTKRVSYQVNRLFNRAELYNKRGPLASESASAIAKSAFGTTGGDKRP